MNAPGISPTPRQYGPFVPQLLMLLAMVGWMAFQGFQLVGERQQLKALEASSVPQEQAAQKVRASLQAVATDTARLATAGNANAQTVVEQLRKRGVTINADTPAKAP